MIKQLHTLASIGGRSLKKRVGRGGDRGKTSGRGTKGQNARAGHKKRPEVRDIIKKLPKRRGYGKNRAQAVHSGNIDATPVSLAALEKNFSNGDTVSVKTLLEKGMVSRKNGREPQVKLLGKEGITKKLTIDARIATSAGAKAAIEKAGGKVA